MTENGNERRGDKMFFVFASRFQYIYADGIFFVRRIEVNDFVGAVLRYVIQQVLNQISVRVNKSDAVIVAQILYDHILQERGLARAGLADDIDMMAAVFRSYAERAALFPKGCFTKPFYFVQMMFVQKNKNLFPVVFIKTKGRLLALLPCALTY